MCSYICVDSLALGLDFIFNHESSKALMVEHFTDLPAIKLEMRVSKVDHSDATDKDDPPRVLISLRCEWIITDFVAEWLVMQRMLLIEGVPAGVTIENVLMTMRKALN